MHTCVYVDIYTHAHIGRELHAAKERAVKAEDYDAAKRLKDAIDRLKQVKHLCVRVYMHVCMLMQRGLRMQ
jgi:hypothetical protein